GYGGDLFAMIWRDGVFAYNGSGRAPAAATADAVRTAIGRDVMPRAGPHTVTVPGAPEAWFALLDRFGTRPFAELAQPAIRYASEGFVLTARATRSISASRQVFAAFRDWQAVYGEAGAGRMFRQPALGATV